MTNNSSEIYDLLRYLWYLLLIPLLFLINRFYQWYFNTSDPFVYFDLLRHAIESGFSYYPLHFIITSCFVLTAAGLIGYFNPFHRLYEQNRLHGSARFAGLSDIKRLGLLKAKGTVLCKWNKKILYVSDPLSILLLAPPGTGKSAGVAVPTLFKNPHSIIALDVKKELFQITSKHRNTFSHVMLFEPTSASTSCWNPLDRSVLPSEFAEIYVRVQQIAANIFIKSESTSDPYWIDSARELFVVIAVALIERDGGTSIPAIYEASLGEGENSRKDAIADLGDDGARGDLYEPVAKKLSAYRHTADQQFSGTLGTFDTGLMGFQDPRVKKAVSRCDIKFEDLRGIEEADGSLKPVTLYLVIKPIDVERLSPLIRVFFESLSKHLLSTPWDKKREHMITFLLDEFPRLGAMEDIIKMPALSRGQGVNSILIAQDAGQIERVYKKSGREEIMSTTAYKIIPSQNSFESAKLISDSIGDMTIKSSSSSHSNTDFIKASTTRREQGQKLLTPQNIMSLKFGACYVISQFASETPIKGKLYLWFKDRELLKLAGELDESEIFRPENHIQKAGFQVSADAAGFTGDELPAQDVIDQFYNGDAETGSLEPDTSCESGGDQALADSLSSNPESSSDDSLPSSTGNDDLQDCETGNRRFAGKTGPDLKDESPGHLEAGCSFEDGLVSHAGIDLSDDQYRQSEFNRSTDQSSLAEAIAKDAASIG